jgi:hypothetical protein
VTQEHAHRTWPFAAVCGMAMSLTLLVFNQAEHVIELLPG